MYKRQEYEGYEGNEKWAIISELSEKELFGLYPDKMRRYSPVSYTHLDVYKRQRLMFILNWNGILRNSMNTENRAGV